MRNERARAMRRAETEGEKRGLDKRNEKDKVRRAETEEQKRARLD